VPTTSSLSKKTVSKLEKMQFLSGGKRKEFLSKAYSFEVKPIVYSSHGKRQTQVLKT